MTAITHANKDIGRRLLKDGRKEQASVIISIFEK